MLWSILHLILRQVIAAVRQRISWITMLLLEAVDRLLHLGLRPRCYIHGFAVIVHHALLHYIRWLHHGLLLHW